MHAPDLDTQSHLETDTETHLWLGSMPQTRFFSTHKFSAYFSSVKASVTARVSVESLFSMHTFLSDWHITELFQRQRTQIPKPCLCICCSRIQGTPTAPQKVLSTAFISSHYSRTFTNSWKCHFSLPHVSSRAINN